MVKKVTPKTTLAQILDISGVEMVLAKNGVPCVTCPYAKIEMDKLQIGKICKMYELDQEKILKELNKKVGQ